MASIAAALAALTVVLWLLGIVLMSTSYQQTGVLIAGIGFVTGVAHAALRWREASHSPSELPAREPTPPSGETWREVVMNHETQSQKFFGLAAMSIALAIAVGVVGYFIQVFWRNQTPDLGLMAGNIAIPPETYPIILLSLWTLSQRGMSTWRPQEGTLGAVAWWVDLISSAGVFAFLAYTFFSAVMGGTQHQSFLIILFAFLMQGFGDLFLNGRHYYDRAGGPANDLLNGILTGNAAIGPFTVKPKVVLEPEYYVVQPDGTQRQVQPEQIPAPPAH